MKISSDDRIHVLIVLGVAMVITEVSGRRTPPLPESAIWRFNEEEALLSRRHYPSLPEEASTPAPSLVDMETIIDAKARRIVHLNADAGKNQRMTLPNSPKESRFDPNAAQYPFLTKTTERSSNEDR